ncbi:hypothetical protein D3C72_2232140 [compost metagenome]
MPEGVIIPSIMLFSVDTHVVQVARARRRGRRQPSKEARGGVAPAILVVVQAIEQHLGFFLPTLFYIVDEAEFDQVPVYRHPPFRRFIF